MRVLIRYTSIFHKALNTTKINNNNKYTLSVGDCPIWSNLFKKTSCQKDQLSKRPAVKKTSFMFP